MTDKILSHLGFRAAFLAGQKTGHGLVDVVTVGAGDWSQCVRQVPSGLHVGVANLRFSGNAVSCRKLTFWAPSLNGKY